MAEYKAVVRWAHTHGNFAKGTFSREHTWTFDGGVTIPRVVVPIGRPRALVQRRLRGPGGGVRRGNHKLSHAELLERGAAGGNPCHQL